MPFHKLFPSTQFHNLGTKSQHQEIYLWCCSDVQALRFYGSSVVTVTGITIQNSPQTHLKFDDCTGVQVSGVTVSSPGDSPNTDGIHLQNSQNVVIYSTNLACGKSKNLKVLRLVLLRTQAPRLVIFASRSVTCAKLWQSPHKIGHHWHLSSSVTLTHNAFYRRRLCINTDRMLKYIRTQCELWTWSWNQHWRSREG